MPNLNQVRQRMMVALVTLAIVDVAAAAFLVSPLAQDQVTREHALEQAQDELQIKTREVEPLRGMDQKLKRTDQDLSVFYRNRLPSKDSAIAAELGKLAAKNGVRISGAKYDLKDSGLPGLTRVSMDAALEGEYVNTVKFINSLERDKMFFVVNSIALGQQQGGAVRLQLKLETYLKS
jgi:type IV pilus assembly protein PilO